MLQPISLGNINIRYLIHFLIKNMWIAITVGFIFFLAGNVFLHREMPTYYSSDAVITVFRSDIIPLPENIKLRSEHIDLAVKDLSSDDYLRTIREKTGIKDVRINAEKIPDTTLIRITCTSEIPRSAYTSLKYILTHFDIITKYISEDRNFVLIRDATIPRNGITEKSPMPSPFVLAGAGILLTCFALCCVYMLPSTYKGTKKVFREFGDDILQVIPYYDIIDVKKKSFLAKLPFLSKGNKRREAADFELEKLAFLLDQKLKINSNNVFLFTSVQDSEGKHTICDDLVRRLTDAGHDIFYMDGSLMNIMSDVCISERYIIHDENLGCDTVKAAEERITYSQESVSSLINNLRKTKDLIVICGVDAGNPALLQVWANLSDTTFLIIRENTSKIKNINALYNDFKYKFRNLGGCILNAFY